MNFEELLALLPKPKPSHIKIDFNDPWVDLETPYFLREGFKKSFEEIELHDLRDRIMVNSNRVITLHDGDKVRFLKGEVYKDDVVLSPNAVVICDAKSDLY